MIRFRPFAFCLAVAVTVAAALWPLLGSEHAYTEFVVGPSSWRAENKTVDYQAFAVVVIVFLALAWLLRRVLERHDDGPASTEGSVQRLIGLVLLPLALWLGMAVTRNTAPDFPYAFALAAGVLLVFGAWLPRRSPRVDDTTLLVLGQLVLCSFLLAFFAGLGCLLLLFHASGHALPASPFMAYAIVLVALAVNGVVVASAFVRQREGPRLVSALGHWVVLLQYPLPLLGLVLLPAVLTYRGATEAYAWPWKLMLALAAYAVWTWWRLTQRRRSSAEPDGAIAGAIEPLALAMIAVFLTSPHASFELLTAPGYPTLFGDDFHLGEQILPWQQWFDFSRVPYVDFAPVHGLMPIMTGALNEFFFDGALAHLNSAFAVLVAIASVLTVCLASRTAGAIAGLALAFLVAPFDRLLFLAPALLLLADAALMARPLAWLSAWLATTLFMVGYNAAVGSALAGATAPFALLALYRAIKGGKPALTPLALLGVAAAATLALTPHFWAMLGGLALFIAENGATNTIGHGIPLSRGFGVHGNPEDGVLVSRILYDMLRLSWIAVMLYALQSGIAQWRESRQRGGDAVASGLPFAIGLALLLLAVWSIGRIDAGHPSRPGAVSFLAVATLLPILCLRHGRLPPVNGMLLYALVIGLFAGMHGLLDRYSPLALVARAAPRVEVPSTLVRANDESLGSRRMRGLFVRPENLAEIGAFKRALERVLPPGETYFDLTNRQALYFYLGHPVPALYSATFNALNERQQRRVLRQLAIHPPVAVFAAPALEGDEIKASLRSFFLYRYFVRGYRPVVEGPFTFLVSARSPAFPKETDPRQEEALLDAVFAHTNLQMIPSAWGRSWHQLKTKARALGEFANAAPIDGSTCAPPSTSLGTYELPANVGNAGVPDLIEIRLRSDARKPATLTLRYASRPGLVGHAMTMEVRGDTLIVPVGAYPSWLRSSATPSIELCAPSGDAASKDLIAGVAAWSIPDVAP